MWNWPADVGGQYCPCPALVSFLSGFSGKKCPVSVCCPTFLSGVYLSGFCLSRFCPLSGFCPEFSKRRCPLSVCPAGQGRDRAVQTFTVLVRRRLPEHQSSLISFTSFFVTRVTSSLNQSDAPLSFYVLYYNIFIIRVSEIEFHFLLTPKLYLCVVSLVTSIFGPFWKCKSNTSSE